MPPGLRVHGHPRHPHLTEPGPALTLMPIHLEVITIKELQSQNPSSVVAGEKSVPCIPDTKPRYCRTLPLNHRKCQSLAVELSQNVYFTKIKSLKIDDLCIIRHGTSPIFLTQPSKILQNAPQTTLWAYCLCVPCPFCSLLLTPPPSGKAQWGFLLIVSSSRTYLLMVPGSRSLAVVFPLQLLPWALGSKGVQSLGQKRP